MAKYERTLHGDMRSFLSTLNKVIIDGSMSASYEDGSDCIILGNVYCAVRVYERYSFAGGNRVSLNVTVCGSDEEFFLSAITSGGSQALFFKINTVGEESFLEEVIRAVNEWERA